MFMNCIVVVGLGISVLASAQTLKSDNGMLRSERLKKGAKIAGFGALAVVGAGLLGTAGVVGVRSFESLNFSSFGKSQPQPPQAQGSDSDKASLAIGLVCGAGIGTGMLSYGIYGLKKTIYGQTVAEKQAEQELNDKVKETIKETGKATIDITKRLARVTGYSIAATVGISSAILSVVHFVKIGMKNKGFLPAAYKEFQDDPRSFVGYTIASPLGAGAIAFGIHGLRKEYRSWKESKTHQNVVNVVQAIKDTVGETFNGAINGAVNVIVPGNREESIQDVVHVSLADEPKQVVDVTTQTSEVNNENN